MIIKTEVMDLLLKSCPSYTSRWNEYYEDSYSNGEEILLYVDLGDFAAHVVELLKKKQLNEFDNIFEVIEQLHTEGDEFVKEAATIGLLEGLQNVAMNNGLNPDDFIKYLKPVSLKWWNDLNDFWSGKTKYVGEPKSRLRKLILKFLR